MTVVVIEKKQANEFKKCKEPCSRARLQWEKVDVSANPSHYHPKWDFLLGAATKLLMQLDRCMNLSVGNFPANFYPIDLTMWF
jgi:hypothetical protein